jgi:hypothetical protein
MSQPANQNNNQPNQPTILEQAKQGQPEAVAALINRSLKPKGLEATAQRQGDCLEITLSSAQVPNPKATTALIQRGMTILQAEGLRRVKVRSRRNDGALAWEQEFTIAAEVPINVPINGDSKAKETISNITHATQPRGEALNPQPQTSDPQNSPNNDLNNYSNNYPNGTSAGTLIAENSSNSPIPSQSMAVLSANTESPRGYPGAQDSGTQYGDATINKANNMMANLANISSEITVIHSSINNVPEYQDIVVRFMTDGDHGKGEKKIRCLTTLSELLQVINKSTFPFRGVNNNPALQYLLETIADCTVTDEQGDQVLRHMMILQPGYTWQPVNLRLVTKVYIESAPEMSDGSAISHPGITVDLAKSAPTMASWRDSEVTITAAQRSVDELTEIPEASIDDTLEDFVNDFLPGVAASSSLDLVPSDDLTSSEAKEIKPVPTPTANVVPPQALSKAATAKAATETEWQVAASTTAEVSEIAAVSANPSITDSLDDFLGDFISEPDLSQQANSRPKTEVAVRTIRSIQTQMEGDDVFGDMWNGELPSSQAQDVTIGSVIDSVVDSIDVTVANSMELRSNSNSVNNSVADTSDGSLLDWEMEPTNQPIIESAPEIELVSLSTNLELQSTTERAITDADSFDIGWDLVEQDNTAVDPLLEQILAVNLDEITSVTASSLPSLPNLEDVNLSLGNDPLIQQLSAPASLVDSGLDSISATDSLAEDDLFGSFGSTGADSMSSIINALPIPEVTSFGSLDARNLVQNTPQIEELIAPILETVTESLDTVQTDTPEPELLEDLFGGWNEAPKATQKKKVIEEVIEKAIESVAVSSSTQDISSAQDIITKPTNIQTDSDVTSNVPSTGAVRSSEPTRKPGPVLANEIAEIMSARQALDTQISDNQETAVDNIGDDSLFNDFVFSINFNPESQIDSKELANTTPWQSNSNENPPARLSISGLSDEITL